MKFFEMLRRAWDPGQGEIDQSTPAGRAAASRAALPTGESTFTELPPADTTTSPLPAGICGITSNAVPNPPFIRPTNESIRLELRALVEVRARQMVEPVPMEAFENAMDYAYFYSRSAVEWKISQQIIDKTWELVTRFQLHEDVKAFADYDPVMQHIVRGLLPEVVPSQEDLLASAAVEELLALANSTTSEDILRHVLDCKRAVEALRDAANQHRERSLRLLAME